LYQQYAFSVAAAPTTLTLGTGTEHRHISTLQPVMTYCNLRFNLY